MRIVSGFAAIRVGYFLEDDTFIVMKNETGVPEHGHVNFRNILRDIHVSGFHDQNIPRGEQRLNDPGNLMLHHGAFCGDFR